MEEKERFELFGEHCIKDNNPDARCQLLDAYKACVTLNEQDKENQQLKQQLVEKDKEIEKLTEELDDKNFCKDFVDLYTENKLKTQMLHENWKDKISFAVEQLQYLIDEEFEVVYLNDYNSKANIEYVPCEKIENLIKQLKEMM